MVLFLSWLVVAGEPRSIDSGTAWAIIVALGAVISAMAVYIVRMHKVYGKKINDLYDKRIEDLKQNLELVTTLERVVYREKKGGK